MMCLLFDFFAAKIHIYIHWEIVTKYLFPQKCCPIEDKLFIRNAVLSSQMAVFEDKFIPAPSRTSGCHCKLVCYPCVKYFRDKQAVSRQFVTKMDNLSVLLCQKVHNSTFSIGLVFWYAICLIFCRIR